MNQRSFTPEEKKAAIKLMRREVWVDKLRLLAIFMVVCCHCCDPFTFNPDPAVSNNPAFGFWGAIYQAFLRPCVPLFACMTGLLLLPVKQEMGAFYNKRISRVLWPFLIWSVLYALFPVIVFACGGSKELIISFFVNEQNPSPELSDALVSMCRIPFDFTLYSVHMWFVFLIIGLYLYLPIFSAWLEKATLREKHLVLGIWGITLCIPYAEMFTPQLFGTCSWNSFGMLYYFGGFIGYLLLGHLVQKEWQPRSWGRTLAFATPAFIIGCVATFVGYRLIQTGAINCDLPISGKLAMAFNPQQAGLPYEASHELCLLYCTPNVALMVWAILIVFRKLNTAELRTRAVLANLTACGFGIYLVHYLFVGPANMLINLIGVPMPLVILCSGVMAFLVTWGVVTLLRKCIKGTWFLG